MASDRKQSEKLSLALSLHQSGQLDRAAALYKEVRRAQPRNFDAAYLLALVSAQQGDVEAAADGFAQAIRINPGSVDAHYNRGLALCMLRRFGEAIDSYDRALAIKPDYLDALNNRAATLIELDRFEEALVACDRALAIRPGYVDALNNRATALIEMKRFAEALDACERALALSPNHAEVMASRGHALRAMGRREEALASYDRAVAIRPSYPEALGSRGLLLLEAGRFDESLASCDRALAIAPDDPVVLNNRGIVLAALRRFPEAVASYDRALAVEPAHAEAFVNRGNALQEVNALMEAVASYDAAIARRPDYAEAYVNRGDCLQKLARLDEAAASYARALTLDPGHAFLRGMCLFVRMKLCDWAGLEEDAKDLLQRISRGEPVSNPLPVLALASTLAQQKRAAESWIGAMHSAPSPLPAIAKRATRDKIRLGYFSADLHDHPVAHLMAELFERHDRSRFEVTAFSYGPDTGDEMRQRLRQGFDRFLDVHGKSDKDIVQLACSLEIDIAVDLNGFTQGGRTDIFAMRAAPIQVNYLGYSGTMGAPFMDYLIADETLIPAAHREHYAEKIFWLPGVFMASDSTRRISDAAITRAEAGLPDDAFVFCSFNNSYKIAPATFDCWMRILKDVPGSVLWLRRHNGPSVENLKREAQARGVDPARLVFAGRTPSIEDHLARHRLADLFLDTLPYNAHATTSDALWAGLPVLTRIGDTFAGRVAATLLNAIGLPELVTATEDDYAALAIALARDAGRLAALKQKLAANRSTMPLFDTQRFTRNIEAAYTAMVERYRADLPPDHIRF